jgi:hypothetical protein
MYNIPNDNKIYQYIPFQVPPKYTHFGILGMQVYHLATLMRHPAVGHLESTRIAILVRNTFRLMPTKPWFLKVQIMLLARVARWFVCKPISPN